MWLLTLLLPLQDCDAVMLGVSLTIGDHGDVVALMNKHGCSFQL